MRLKLFILISSVLSLATYPLAGTAVAMIPAATTYATNNTLVSSANISPSDLSAISGSSEYSTTSTADDYQSTQNAYNITDLSQLGAIFDDNTLEITPQDMNALKNYQVDNRVSNYLLFLVTPSSQGGAGLNHVKASSIIKSYSSNGAGQYDRETLDSLSSDNNTISQHHLGEAVDISEVGQVTCKLVEHHHTDGFGTSAKTTWQDPKGVKVAWQSVDGINNNPTPSGQSLIGSAGNLSSQSFSSFLNQSGGLDNNIDYSKGIDLNSMITYAGANNILKDLGASSITSDPLGTNLLQSIGSSSVQSSMPSLAPGVGLGSGSEDFRVNVAKASTEQSLGLVPGSLAGYGWDELLTSIGERHLEDSLNLPALYLDTHSLNDLNNNSTTKAELSSFVRKDDALSVPSGTVQGILTGDSNSIKLAAVNILSSALKLTAGQKSALETAVRNKQTPTLDLATVPATNNVTNVDLLDMFSNDPASQKTSQNSLKTKGLAILTSTKSSATTSSSGLSSEILTSLLNTSNTITSSDLTKQVGVNTLSKWLDLSDTQKDSLNSSNPSSGTFQVIADYLNKEFDLTGSNQITVSDAQTITRNGDYTIAQKIGGAEADKALGWGSGTGYDVVTGHTTLKQATQNSFSNALSEILGINPTNVPLTGNVTQNFSNSYIEQQLGLSNSTFSSTSNSTDLYNTLGQNNFYSLFNINSTKSLGDLASDTGFWGSSNTQASLSRADNSLGLPTGTVEKYLKGQIDNVKLSSDVATNVFPSAFTDTKIYNYFGLDSNYQLDSGDNNKLISSLTGIVPGSSTKASSLNLDYVYKIVGRTIDSKAGFSTDSLFNIISDPSSTNVTSVLVKQGIHSLVGSLGWNVSGADFDKITDTILSSFNSASSGTTTAPASTTQANSFFKEALNIPDAYAKDANYFTDGDFYSGLTVAYFDQQKNAVNPYLPGDDQLTYESLHNTLTPDPTSVGNEAKNVLQRAGVTSPSATQQSNATQLAWKNIVEKTVQTTQFQVSDGLLRKADPNIPAGFSQTMLTGTNQQRASMLVTYFGSNIDSAISKIVPSYLNGTVNDILSGKITAQSTINSVDSLILSNNINLGPINSSQLVLYINYFSQPASYKDPNFFVNSTSQPLWSSINSWFGTALNIPNLPPEFSQTLFLGLTKGWDAVIKDTNGVVQLSIQNFIEKYSIANIEGYIGSKVSNFADNALGLPSGTAQKLYDAYTNKQSLSNVIEADIIKGLPKNIQNDIQTLRDNNFSEQSVEYVVITEVLNACKSCQKVFSAIDNAIQAPPGFTNKLVAGAVAMMLGMGPAGMISAAVYYFTGVYKVDYLCPTPPKDTFSYSGYDPPEDQLDYGYDYNPTTDPLPNATKTAANFSDGNDQKLWMAWSRYYTGLLVQDTLIYSAYQNQRDNVRQLITYRQANAEYFQAQNNLIKLAFSGLDNSNPYVGIGYTQGNTKASDRIYVAFGGLY